MPQIEDERLWVEERLKAVKTASPGRIPAWPRRAIVAVDGTRRVIPAGCIEWSCERNLAAQPHFRYCAASLGRTVEHIVAHGGDVIPVGQIFAWRVATSRK